MLGKHRLPLPQVRLEAVPEVLPAVQKQEIREVPAKLAIPVLEVLLRRTSQSCTGQRVVLDLYREMSRCCILMCRI